jgi:putative membrane protein
MNTGILSAAAAAAVLLGSLPGFTVAAEGAQARADNRGAPPASEMTARQFATQVAEGGLAEVRLSELARQRSSDPQVREFAARMIADHGEANADLQAIAKRKGITLPQALSAGHEATLKALQSAQGARFDAAYLAAMREDHIRTIALLQVANGPTFEDADLKVFASRTLPVVEQHFQLIESIEGRATPAAVAR